jgi:hypothetical protein
MEIHPPHGRIKSVREFCVHLLTVIIGILIALSLEGLLERHHHRSLLHEARANIAAEIRENQERLQRGLAAAPAAEAELRRTMEVMEAHRRNPQAPWSDFNWGFGLFPLASTAWSSAASTGAISYMDYSEVQLYTRAYLLQDQFLSVQQSALDRWLDLQKWAERTSPPNGRPTLGLDDLSQIEGAAAAALVYTQTEESVATSLSEQYAKVLDAL